jgi:phage baseplate assembly protein gpV
LVPRVGTIVEYDGELHRYRVKWSSKRTWVKEGALVRVGEAAG